ncbi:MAG: DUF898 domain-containing protein [Proteobacteria bacterium]|nr:DUF898 domain-containing protein [Pseudomonadota bacterium]
METASDNVGPVSFEFNGKASEYFSIWIVNVCLTILTLGIYSAWAKVRNNQYFYGNTQLDGVSFRYLADPVKILKGRIIAFIAFAAYYFSGMVSPVAAALVFGILMILTPAFMVMSMSFRMRNSAWRNVRFDFNKDYKKAYLILAMPVVVIGLYMYASYNLQPTGEEVNSENMSTILMVAMVGPLAIFLFFPWWEFMINRFQLNQSSYGKADFTFGAKAKQYYFVYIAAIAVFVIGAIAAGAVIAGVAAVSAAAGSEEAKAGPPMALLIGIWFAILPLYLWMGAFVQARKTNLIVSNITVGKHKLESDLKVGYMMFLYLTNTLAIAFSAGLLMPWAKVRTARYKASRTRLLPAGNLESFVAAEYQAQSALGEEVGEIFDMDLGL